MNVVTFDLETRRLAAELPDSWAGIKRGDGGMSCLCAWSSLSGRPYFFDDNDPEAAAAFLETADCLLSFNGVGFDLPIVEGLAGRPVAVKQHLDMLQLVWQALDIRSGSHKGNTLEESARRTLGRGKSGKGTMAPQLARDGLWAQLFSYCFDDVWLTRDLFKYAQQHGGIIGPTGDLLTLQLPEWFAEAEI